MTNFRDAFGHMTVLNSSITETDAMIVRLLKLIRQLQQQNDYIDSVVSEMINDDPNLDYDDSKHEGLRYVGMYKHDEADKTQMGGTQKPIFNDKQQGTSLESSEGMSNTDVLRFLIGVNAILTQTNDDSSTAGGASDDVKDIIRDAVVPKNNASADDAGRNPGDMSDRYRPGGNHRLNSQVLQGIIPGSYNGDAIRYVINGNSGRSEGTIEMAVNPVAGDVYRIRVPSDIGGTDTEQMLEFVTDISQINNKHNNSIISINTKSNLIQNITHLTLAIMGMSSPDIKYQGMEDASAININSGVRGIEPTDYTTKITMKSTYPGEAGNSITVGGTKHYTVAVEERSFDNPYYPEGITSNTKSFVLSDATTTYPQATAIELRRGWRYVFTNSQQDTYPFSFATNEDGEFVDTYTHGVTVTGTTVTLDVDDFTDTPLFYWSPGNIIMGNKTPIDLLERTTLAGGAETTREEEGITVKGFNIK